MSEIREVRVVVHPNHTSRWGYPDGLHFDLVFDDRCIKSYHFDSYQIASYRMSERDMFTNLAQDYYEQLYGIRPAIVLIFY